MPDCSACGKPLAPPTVKCLSCGAELHRACAKRVMGRSYCKKCYKQAKKQARYERMAQRAEVFGAKRPTKVW
jgi:predicted amidophosphoribosyltransferase